MDRTRWYIKQEKEFDIQLSIPLRQHRMGLRHAGLCCHTRLEEDINNRTFLSGMKQICTYFTMLN